MFKNPLVHVRDADSHDFGGDDPTILRFMQSPRQCRCLPGAPVLDVEGRLIGLVDGRLHGMSTGSWTIIPLRTIKKILPLLENGGGVPRGVLGIYPVEENVPVGSDFGVRIRDVVSKSPAASAGIFKEDVISGSRRHPDSSFCHVTIDCCRETQPIGSSPYLAR